MVIFIGGGSHTGKTLLAQKLVRESGYFCLSVDHLKMGLIRSGYCSLTPESSFEELTEYLWPVVREMAKTAVENRQNVIFEGCYIPFDWKKDFAPEYLISMKYICLIFSEAYISAHMDDILAHGNDAEQRLEDGWCREETLLAENRRSLEGCKKYGCEYIYIDGEYRVDAEAIFSYI